MLEIKEDFHIRLEKAMALREKKAIDIVNATGISQSAFSQYRSGHTKPKRTNLMEIANYLKVNPAWLMGLDVPMELSASSIDDPLPTDETQKAIALYERYKNASPEIQKAIEMILKSSEPSL